MESVDDILERLHEFPLVPSPRRAEFGGMTVILEDMLTPPEGQDMEDGYFVPIRPRIGEFNFDNAVLSGKSLYVSPSSCRARAPLLSQAAFALEPSWSRTNQVLTFCIMLRTTSVPLAAGYGKTESDTPPGSASPGSMSFSR
jgi:hypothetical protein